MSLQHKMRHERGVRRKRWRGGASAAAALVLAIAVTPVAASASEPTAENTSLAAILECQDLVSTDLSGVLDTTGVVTSAQVVETENGSYCQVQAEVGAATKFEARMPLTTWNGRYLQLGCGGMCGAIRFGVTPAADSDMVLKDNRFVVAATNEGHNGPQMLGGGASNELRADYGYRSNHWTAVAVKHLIEVFYGQPASFSYFQGYSDGGRAAVNEAQRYPEDFDGIIAGAPAIYTSESLTAAFIWRGMWASTLSPEARQLLAAGALAACDPADGVVDGQISNPAGCNFDPATLVCGEGGANCLTAEEAAAAQKLYEGPRTDTGEYMHPGGLPEGSELNWPANPGPVPTDFGRYLAFAEEVDPNWTWEDFTFTLETYEALQPMAGVYNADNGKQPDLRKFDDAGGKLIVWYGLADASTGQDSTLDWYAQVQETSGGLDAVREFARLYQVPGLYHGGGYINYQLQLLPELVNWVETEVAPERVIASATTPVERTYPLFPYPDRAQYSGSGSVFDAVNWAAQTPLETPNDHFPWLGNPYAEPAGEEVRISGTLRDGTAGQVAYEAIKPAVWNGTLILDLDFNQWTRDRREYFLGQGYAIGGNQRTQNETAYELKQYVDNLVVTREFLIEAIAETGQLAEPTRTIAWGNSRGGFVARMAAQYRPDVFDGAIGSAGGGAGVVASWLSKADAVGALQQLVNPEAGLAINGLPDIPEGATYGPRYEEDVKLVALVDEAKSSEEGMARLVLAGAFEQATDFSSGDIPPEVGDFHAQGLNIAAGFAFGNPQFVHKEIEVMSGGPIVWNHGVDYRDLLDRSGARDRVEWWYEQAGLDLDADLEALRSAPRYAADPDALATVEQIGTYTGTGSPVITIKTVGDSADPAPLDEAYVRTFKASGNEDELLRALLINRSGHGGQTLGEWIAAFEVLEERLDTESWPDVSPEAMNARVVDLASRTGMPESVFGDAGRYISFDGLLPALRTWDFTNWGTYRVPAKTEVPVETPTGKLIQTDSLSETGSSAHSAATLGILALLSVVAGGLLLRTRVRSRR